MRKFYFALVFVLIAFNSFSQQAPFITTWEVMNDDLNIAIRTVGDGYDFTVDFGDGTVVHNAHSTQSHTYGAPGIYTVTISGAFPRLDIVGESRLQQRIQSVEQWGDIQWQTMERAFYGCSNLVINATDAPDLSQVTDLRYMFSDASSLNQSINHWDVSNATKMERMFAGATSFNQPLNSWDVSQVIDMRDIFLNATSFNQSINDWDISNGPFINGMFSGATSFNQSINNWDVSNVTNMSRIFNEASSFNQPLDNWDVSNVIGMTYMFKGASSFNQSLNMWDVSNVTSMDRVFNEATSFNQPLDNWDVSGVTSISRMFQGATSFNQNINNWDVSSVTRMTGTFASASSFNQPLGNWNVSNVRSLSADFRDSGIFENATSFNQPINNWDVSNVTLMNSIFMGATSFNQPLNDWNVSNVTNMEEMFKNATTFDQPLDNWDVSNVIFMSNMFAFATSFNQSINDWDISNVYRMNNMFAGASSFNQPLYHWNISNVGYVDGLLYSASNFDQDISNWDFRNISAFDNFITNTNMRPLFYDRLLVQLASLGIENKHLTPNNLQHCNDQAKTELIYNLGWYIEDSGLSPDCNTIMGTVLYGENNDGCDTNDMGINGLMVNINDGTNNFTSFSNDGIYSSNVSGTDFTVSLINYPSYFTASPTSATVTFTNSDIEEVDFCVTANQTIEDLNVILLPLIEARPGFESSYKLVVSNMGTVRVANVSVSLVFDDEKQSFVSAQPTPDSTSGNELNFEITDLLPFGVQTISITMQTFAPPIVNGGDILSFTANVSPVANDNTPDDNTFVLDQIVVNSFDPNDKQVLEGEEISLDQADEYLHYLIRFQNTGTASAVNVRILDTLHTKLDWNTILPIDASHPYHVEITEGNRMEFFFDSIDLPAEEDNEPESHGYVAYKIKPKGNVQVGDVITGNARIYFDFNLPIVTNTVSTEIVDNLGIDDDMSLENQIVIYPNPADKTVYIHLTNGLILEDVKLFNLQGQAIRISRENSQTLDVENLTSGIYFLKVITNRGTVNQRIIKK